VPLPLSTRCLFAPKCHHSARHLRHQFVVVFNNVADVPANHPSHVHRLSDRAQPAIPGRPKEIDLQINTGKALPLLQTGCVCHTDRGVSDVAHNTAVNRAHWIPMDFGIGKNLDRGGARTDINQLEPQSSADCRRVDEARSLSGNLAGLSDSSEKLEIR
jgi:hypothetical protein